MNYKIDDILEQEPNSYQGLTKTTFLSEGKTIYIFTKPENNPSAGDTLEGDVKEDKGGRLKFTKTKAEGFDRKAYDGPKKGMSMRDDSAIKAQWSINASIALLKDKATLETVEPMAKKLFAMVERVKVGDSAATLEDIDKVFGPGSELV